MKYIAKFIVLLFRMIQYWDFLTRFNFIAITLFLFFDLKSVSLKET